MFTFARPLVRHCNKRAYAMDFIVNTDGVLSPWAIFHKNWPRTPSKLPTHIKDTIQLLSNGDSANHNFPPFFAIDAKAAILDEIQDKIATLQTGGFTGRVGTSTRLIIGEKGIGKSDVLRRAVVAAALTHPRLIPIYVEYTNILDRPLELVLQAIERSNLIQPNPDELAQLRLADEKCETGPFSQFLTKHDLYCLLVCDELDSIYTSTAAEGQRLNILRQMCALGCQRSGRFVTIACGSASALPLLITKNGVHVPELLAEFPLVSNAPNLNGQKFPSMMVKQHPLNPPVLREIYSKILGRDVSIQEANILSFFSGNNLRRITQVAQAVNKLWTQSGAVEFIEMRTTQLWDTRADHTRKRYELLINALNKKLIRSNRPLLRALGNVHRDRDRWMKQVSTISWSINLAGIDRNTLHGVLKETGFQETDLHALVDKGWFCSTSNLETIYPSTAFTLYCESQLISPPWINPFRKIFPMLLQKPTIDLLQAQAHEALKSVPALLAEIGSRVPSPFN
eukprot:c3991_g1_i1.p1 GENE.c3991_g1_i1~~c3991_g1_i1.p1  ORF type:complete len:525 (+),score=51.55 c3991_g1_i1:43-1575(+)